MSYSARPDVEARLAALPEVEQAGPIYDKINARVEQGIEYADAEIDATLAAVYATPFCPVPKLILHISADLAAAFSLDGGFSGGGEDNPTKLADAYRKRAQRLLEKLAERKSSLPGATPLAPPSAVSSQVVATHSHLGQRPTLEDFNLYNEPGSCR